MRTRRLREMFATFRATLRATAWPTEMNRSDLFGIASVGQAVLPRDWMSSVSAGCRGTRWQVAIVAVLCALFVVQPSRADDLAKPGENGDPLIVRDVAVYLLSAYGDKLNERGLFESTLPSYTLSRRPTASRKDGNIPVPTGIITFEGPAEEDVDVLLEFDKGRFLSHWPPGRMRSKRLLWASVDISFDAPAKPSSMPQGHWLLPLRDAERLYIAGNKHNDRFLIYDAELPYVPHVTLKRSENGYAVTNTGKFPVHDVTICRPAGDGQWELATVAQVDAVKKKDDKADDDAQPAKGDAKSPDAKKKESPEAGGATEEAEAKAAADKKKAVKVAKEAAAAIATALAAAIGQPSVEQPAGDASKTPKKEKEKPLIGVTSDASIVGTLTANQALDGWRTSLAAMNLDSPEVEFVLGILKQQALRTDSAMLVYRMDEAQLDDLLPLEVTPYPDRLFRVALVIVQDADPDLQSKIETFVAQLGHDEWRQREQAQQDLGELGLAAKPKLEAALKHKDAEIVFRAEQLLEALKSTP